MKFHNWIFVVHQYQVSQGYHSQQLQANINKVVGLLVKEVWNVIEEWKENSIILIFLRSSGLKATSAEASEIKW